MKKYHIVVPEVIVGLGERTIFDNLDSAQKHIIKLHVELEDWLGDDLMLNSKCFIITEELKIGLKKNIFTGYEIVEMETTKAEYFDENYSLNKPLPKFYWMKIIGRKNIDDCYYLDTTLYMTNEFIEYLKKKFSMKHLEIDPEHDEFDEFLDKMFEERDKKSSN